MKTKDIFRTIARAAILVAKRKGAQMVEIVLSHGTEDLTRFANNMIHQSVSMTDSLVHVRVVVDGKIGVARANQLSDVRVKDTVDRAILLASFQQADPHFVGLPNKSTYEDVHRSLPKQEHVGAIGRAHAIRTIIQAAVSRTLVASGAFSESDSASAVANSNGVWAYQESSSASLSTIVMGEKGSGFASHSARGGSAIPVSAVAHQAVYKATEGDFIDIEPGEYEVILEPPAVAELMDFFSWLGPNARVYHEDVSFYQGNMGKQIFDEKLTIYDDPLAREGYPTSFDWEGFPKKKTAMVKNGTLAGIAYDSYHASKYGAKNTGHALLAPNEFGPIATHLVIAPGNKTLEASIKNVKKGLLVTRFWYTRVIQHKQLTLTGMTRDGTFYIENGKIKGRVRNLRYTESVVEAFKDIRGIGNELQLIGSEGSPSLVPHVHVGKFRFTGVTKHG